MEWSSGSLSCNCRRSPERVIWRRRRRGFARWCRRRAKTCPAMDLVVFPEYSLHGLSTDTNAELMSRLDGPEVASFRQACIDTASGLFLHHGIQSPRQPVQFRPHHRRRRRYQVLLPRDASLGAGRALGAAKYRHYRQQGCTDHLPNVCTAGTDGVFNSMGEGMIVNFDGVPLVTGSGAPDEIITAEVRPKFADEARRALGCREQHLPVRPSRTCRGGGSQECAYTYMRDLP